MQIFKEGPTIVLHKIPKCIWLSASAWILLFAINQGVDLFLILSDLAISCPVEIVIPKPVDRSI